MHRRACLKSSAIMLCCLSTVGCVERTMTFTTTPPGSLVYLNGQEVGRTPLKRDFTWYGTYDVTIRKEGYETLKTTQKVDAPWYQIIPIDLVVEMWPTWVEDNRSYQFNLTPSPNVHAVPGPGLLTRAEQMRADLMGSRRTTTRPAD